MWLKGINLSKSPFLTISHSRGISTKPSAPVKDEITPAPFLPCRVINDPFSLFIIFALKYSALPILLLWLNPEGNFIVNVSKSFSS